jgi:ribonuclease HI
MKIELIFDGGCSPNPGEKYGSYEVLIDGQRKHFEPRLSLGHGTNNEAEFEILIVALERIADYLKRRGTDKKTVEIEMSTDSTIVANRISGKNRKGVFGLKLAQDSTSFLGPVEEKLSAKRQAERRMAALAQKCLNVLAEFKSYQIQWIPRDKNVERFGH